MITLGLGILSLRRVICILQIDVKIVLCQRSRLPSATQEARAAGIDKITMSSSTNVTLLQGLRSTSTGV